jgi:hypothetical protein
MNWVAIDRGKLQQDLLAVGCDSTLDCGDGRKFNGLGLHHRSQYLANVSPISCRRGVLVRANGAQRSFSHVPTVIFYWILRNVKGQLDRTSNFPPGQKPTFVKIAYLQEDTNE